jgi:hypothetical protein
MRINYEFITGERLEIEVEDGIGEIIIEMENMQSRRNRTETRRHNSLEFMQEAQEGHMPMQFTDEKADVEQMVINADEKEKLHQAIQKLEMRIPFMSMQVLMRMRAFRQPIPKRGMSLNE